MEWLALHIDTTPAGIEPVSLLLQDCGVESIVIDDEQDFHDFLENNHQYWDYVDEQLLQEKQGKYCVSFYLEKNDEGWQRLAMIRIALNQLKKEQDGTLGSLLLSMEDVQDADWENQWKEFYHPLPIGKHLLIVPYWEDIPKEQQRTPIILDPGLTFGTGNHPTTRLCLETLEEQIHGGEEVLDLGCGSGILSITSLLLGASEATAMDIDPQCMSVAYRNASYNGIGKDRYLVYCRDVLQSPPEKTYDVVTANIVADVIIALSPVVSSYLKPQGIFLCSGVIDTRSEEVQQALLSSQWNILKKKQENGWFSFLCQPKET